MRAIKIEPSDAAKVLAEALESALKNHPLVTWLVPGGSNIQISVAALELIPAELAKNLVIAQTDERYGPLNHPDSNWKQLADAGLKLGDIPTFPVLTELNLPLDLTAERYGKITAEILRDTYAIGQFGIGDDGHIAGILPDTPASVASGLVCGYEASDFSRITLTFSAIKQLNEAYAFAFGKSKFEALDGLANDTHSLIDQPSQVLKSIDKSFIYSDQLGEVEK